MSDSTLAALLRDHFGDFDSIVSAALLVQQRSSQPQVVAQLGKTLPKQEWMVKGLSIAGGRIEPSGVGATQSNWQFSLARPDLTLSLVGVMEPQAPTDVMALMEIIELRAGWIFAAWLARQREADLSHLNRTRALDTMVLDSQNHTRVESLAGAWIELLSTITQPRFVWVALGESDRARVVATSTRASFDARGSLGMLLTKLSQQAPRLARAMWLVDDDTSIQIQRRLKCAAVYCVPIINEERIVGQVFIAFEDQTAAVDSWTVDFAHAIQRSWRLYSAQNIGLIRRATDAMHKTARVVLGARWRVQKIFFLLLVLTVLASQVVTVEYRPYLMRAWVVRRPV